MKVGTKPVSSPGRAAEKYYTPPIMRFLRTNVASRSRGRSARSSPLMFGRKKTNLHHSTNKNPSSSLDTQQEPSSPKVTCMGQVRVRRRSSSKHSSSLAPPECSCCRVLKDKIRVKPRIKFGAFGRPSCPNWGFLFPTKKGKDSCPKWGFRFPTKKGKNSGNTLQKKVEQSEEEEEERGRVRAYISAGSISTPPKNALLLTRCRSAPYRSSSLACRFWSEETEDPKQNVEVDFDLALAREEENSKGIETPLRSKGESLSKEESDVGLGSDVKVGVIEEYIDLSRHGNNGVSRNLNDEELMRRVVEDGGGALRPWTLTRCKSEPAITGGGQKNHELGFWKKRRLGFT